MKNINIEEQHTLLLEISKVFHQICANHNIPYFMLGGTMLGAVRHKGFIPWDDDMDFGVPREHFETLIRILEDELPSPYKLLTMDNSDILLTNYLKIDDTRTIIKERYKENAHDTFGVNIDVFPLDECNGKKGKLSKNFLIQTLVKVQLYRFLSARSRPWYKKLIAYTIKTLLFGIKKRTIINFIENHLLTKGQYFANHYGFWGCREIVSKGFFGEGELYKFEDTKFCGVIDYDGYLKALYNDYMQLPPEEKRHIHHVSTFWK